MLNHYETYCRASGMRPSTIRLRIYWLRRASAHFDLATATGKDLVAWLGGHDWQPETRKSARNALRSFYGWAREDFREDDPTVRLPRVSVPCGVPRPAPTEVLRCALATASQRDQLIISLAAFAGLRRAEIAGLTWSSVTWAGIHVIGKGGRSRTIPLLPHLRKMLFEEAERRGSGQVAEGFRYWVDPGSPYLFPSHHADHAHMTPGAVGKIIAWRLPGHWTGHALRHRFATKAYAVDRDLLTVQQLLGHSKPETTARYTAVPTGAAAAAVAGVAA